jgi:phenylalanyl-tRNA synthetase beta chain
MAMPGRLDARTADHIQTTDDVLAARAKSLPTPPPQLKIEIPANRYDLLCLEGVARALRVFLGKEKPARYTLSAPEKVQEVFVEASVSETMG